MAPLHNAARSGLSFSAWALSRGRVRAVTPATNKAHGGFSLRVAMSRGMACAFSPATFSLVSRALQACQQFARNISDQPHCPVRPFSGTPFRLVQSSTTEFQGVGRFIQEGVSHVSRSVA